MSKVTAVKTIINKLEDELRSISIQQKLEKIPKKHANKMKNILGVSKQTKIDLWYIFNQNM